MSRRSDERGLSNSVQYALLLPFSFGILLLTIQWALVFWAEATALAAAQEGAAVAAALDGSESAGMGAAAEAANNGSLNGLTVEIERGPRRTTAVVTASALTLLWPREISETVVVATERLS